MTNVVDLQAHRRSKGPPEQPEYRWWQDVAAFVLRNAKNLLNKRELVFLGDMAQMLREPSPKQMGWLDALHMRAHAFLRGKAKLAATGQLSPPESSTG